MIVLSILTNAHIGTAVSDLFDSIFSATVSEKIDGMNVVDYSTPKLYTMSDGLQFEFPSVPEEPEAIDEYVEWYKPKPGDTVFDLGANAGITTYQFSKMVGPTGRIISFEPDPILLPYIKRNIARHKLENVTLIEAAIGAKDGTANFFSEGTTGSSLEHTQDRSSKGDVVEVPIVSLPTAIAKFGAPNFCKMDIEGAEIETLESVVDLISTKNIHFVVDTGHLRNGEFSDRRVEEAFRRAGYITETKYRFSVITYAGPQSADRVLPPVSEMAGQDYDRSHSLIASRNRAHRRS